MTQHRRGLTLALFLGCGLLGSSCIDDAAKPSGPPPIEPTECGVTNAYRRGDFTQAAWIDNRWFPLLPGKQFILDGTANRGGGIERHRVVFTVTDLVKVIDGVTTVVLWDRDYNGDQLVEAELAFFAQDKHGNVWSFGEYPEEYEFGEFVGAPSTWIVGRAGAQPGIHMVADPQIGTQFLQGWAPEINFLDCAFVAQMGQRTCVPYNCYENVLVTDETSPLEPGAAHQLKYYAPSVGIVRVGAVDDPEAETLVLLALYQLGPEALAEARSEALRLDARAYTVAPEVYGRTEPARRRP